MTDTAAAVVYPEESKDGTVESAGRREHPTMTARLIIAPLLIAACLATGGESDTSRSDAGQTGSVSIETTTPATRAGTGSPAAAATATQTPSGAAGTSAFVIQVTGTNGVAFTGECRSGTSDGAMVPRPLSGTVPARLEVPGNRLSCSVRHGSPTGTLRVQVERGG